MSLPESLRTSLYEESGYTLEDRQPRQSTFLQRSTEEPALDRHTAKTLHRLVKRFVPVDRHDSRADLQPERFDTLYEKCTRMLASNPKPSILEDENSLAAALRQQLMQDPRDTSRASKFGLLYNKLMSQNVLRHRWSVMYLLSLLSSASVTTTSIKRKRPYQSPDMSQSTSDASSFGLEHIHSQPPPISRQRLLYDRDTQSWFSMPPAFQLKKARDQRRTPTSEGITVSESELLRDLIFIFQGIDGQHIKLDVVNNEYVIDSRVTVSQSTKNLVFRLTELGWLFRRIQTFIKNRFDDPSMGLVGQSFCFALQQELKEYYKLIAVLEAQIEKQTAQEDEIIGATEHTLTLKRLLLWTRESSQRLRLMSVLVDACKDQKGGALISTMHDYTKHGDPFIQQYIKAMLEHVSKPFYEMLQRWIYEGELEDPYEEFFVACDHTVSEEELWQSKYKLRENMIPSFISDELAQKIFSIGKSLNFIRYSCHDDTLVERYHASTSIHSPAQIFKYGDILAVERSIDVTYRETSKQLIDLLKQKYKLMDHLRALKRYLLLGQGDFIQYLMDTLGPSLSRPANTLFRHNLTGVLETAIRASNAQYDDPEILNRLDVRLLEISPEDIGWDVFTLDYHLDSPINTVFTAQAMNQYLRMFNFLWRLKRVEYNLSASWRRWGMSARSFPKAKALHQDLHQAQTAISRMIHFIYQLQHYYLFEVLECSWERLEYEIENKSIDLDAIIEAHSLYLNEITEKGFLSGVKNQALSMRLSSMFDTILSYKTTLDHLYTFVSQGDSDENKLERIRSRRKETETKFEAEVHDFLEALASYHDEELRSLSTRLDYNDFYSSSTSISS